jgi:uncharacterized membrane protein YdjX (TVP38/TMEM64 family)
MIIPKNLFKPMLLSGAVLLASFLFVYYVSLNTDIKEIAEKHYILGYLFYFISASVAVIIPVLTNIVLIPPAVMLWGPFVTAVLSILGWWVGSMISFYIARTFKTSLLIRFPVFQKYDHIDRLVFDDKSSTRFKKFYKLIFLRMTFPVDVLSYALGFFSNKVSFRENSITTLIGITPFAFIFSYGSEMLYKNIFIITPILAIIFFIYIIYQTKFSNKK